MSDTFNVLVAYSKSPWSGDTYSMKACVKAGFHDTIQDIYKAAEVELEHEYEHIKYTYNWRLVVIGSKSVAVDSHKNHWSEMLSTPISDFKDIVFSPKWTLKEGEYAGMAFDLVISLFATEIG